MRSNMVQWNPMQPKDFIVANEDSNIYTFDMRRLDAARMRHWDHVMAVLDVSYSPTGQHFVSASYDGTIRTWAVNQQRSQDVYHTKRMARVLCCQFTADSRFVLSGSEDTNIRLWKAKANQKLGTLDHREKRAIAYREELMHKFSRLPEIRRIKRHQHVPKMVKSMATKRRIMLQAQARKQDNRIKHAKPGSIQRVPVKKKHIVKELE